MAMEQKQRDKDVKWDVSILRCTPVSTEAQIASLTTIRYFIEVTRS
jgi:hypothetical protein